MESGVPYAPRTFRTSGNVFRSHELPSHLPSDDERNLSDGGSPRMAISVHGRYCHPHKAPQRRIRRTTQTTAQTINPPSTRKTKNARPVSQAREVRIPETRNRIFRSHRWKRSPQNEPKEIRKHQKLGGTQKSNQNMKVPGVHRILPILRPKLLTNRTTITAPNKENNPLGMDEHTTASLQSLEGTNVQSTSPDSTQL